jgi:hypothetical protein
MLMYHMLMHETPNVDLSETTTKLIKIRLPPKTTFPRERFLRRVYTRRATLPSEKDEDSGDGQGQEEDWGGEAQ